MGEHPPVGSGLTRRLTKADRLALGAGVLALSTGVVVLVVAHGFTATLIGAGLLGLAGIAFVALAFLLVGESEDRMGGSR
jgi:hypothetical protein